MLLALLYVDDGSLSSSLLLFTLQMLLWLLVLKLALRCVGCISHKCIFCVCENALYFTQLLLVLLLSDVDDLFFVGDCDI